MTGSGATMSGPGRNAPTCGTGAPASGNQMANAAGSMRITGPGRRSLSLATNSTPGKSATVALTTMTIGPTITGSTIGPTITGSTIGPTITGSTIGPTIGGSTIGPTIGGSTIGSGATMSGSGKNAQVWSTETLATSRTGVVTAAGSTGMTGTGRSSLFPAKISAPGNPATVALTTGRNLSGVITSGSGKNAPACTTELPATSSTGVRTLAAGSMRTPGPTKSTLSPATTSHHGGGAEHLSTATWLRAIRQSGLTNIA